jgi:hypothetical protein
MVNYKTQPTGNIVDLGGGYGVMGADVVENKTHYRSPQVIASGIPMPEAKEMVRHLNMGGGFNGNTPSFFLQKSKGLEYQEENFYK